MARLLAYNAPRSRHVFTCAGLLAELAGRGHEVPARTRASDLPRLCGLGLRAAADAVQELLPAGITTCSERAQS
jgi:hypothetical protein